MKKGFRVPICERVEDPKEAKGFVKREVVRVVFPETLTDGTISTSVVELRNTRKA